MKTITIIPVEKAIHVKATSNGVVKKHLVLKSMPELKDFVESVKPQKDMNDTWEFLLHEKLGGVIVEWVSKEMASKGYDSSTIGNY